MADTWITTDLNTIFPNRANEFAKVSQELNKSKQEADKIIQSFDQKAEAAAQGLSVTSNLLMQIQASGYSVLYMPPADKEFFNRLAESNNKPFPDSWTAGICIFVQGPSISETTTKYTALLDILAS